MTKNKNPKGKVLVALSGGVDSAVAAALLKKQGYEVIGVHFVFFDTWTWHVQVGKLANKLGIKLIECDAKKKFRKRVIECFLDAYKKGVTPNPCVVCNKEIKFRLLFDLMKKYKADYIATGHYACLGREFRKKSQFQNPNYKLLSAKNKSKDQSYFLYKLTQQDLKKIIFPLGNYEKTEIKRMAKKMKMSIADGKESQDICFLKEKSLETFLKEKLPKYKWKAGDIKDTWGKALGEHRGLSFYTIGQRRGIEIGPPASRQEREVLRASGTRPYYVVGKNLRRNELIVTNDPKKLLTKKFFVNQVNWINPEISLPLRAQVQIRYHAEKFPAIIKKRKDGKYAVETARKLRAVTLGQSAVFYKNGEVLGGGTIAS